MPSTANTEHNDVTSGGSWQDIVEINLRPEFRYYATSPAEAKNTYGFRVLLNQK